MKRFIQFLFLVSICYSAQGQSANISLYSSNLYIVGVTPTSYNSPGGEGATNAFDGNAGTKYLNFDKANAGVTIELNQGRVVNSFTVTTANDFSGRDPTSYKLYGSNSGSSWALIQEGSLALSSSRFTTSAPVSVSNTSAYVYYFMIFPTTKAGVGCGLNCDSMQIAELTYQYDPLNTTTSTKTSGGTISNPGTSGATVTNTGPTVTGGTITQNNAPNNQTILSGGSYVSPRTNAEQTRINTWTNNVQSYNNELYIQQTYGSNNNVTITQTGTKNRIDATIGGNGNIVNNTQTGSNYLKEEIPGWGNNVTVNQNTTSIRNYAETKIQGNGNTVNHTQTGTGNHILFSNVAGDINTVNSTQSGTAGHALDVKLTGNFNSVISNQTGNTANNANVELTNAGGAATLDLEQTGGKSFTIIQSCVNPAGCSTVVR